MRDWEDKDRETRLARYTSRATYLDYVARQGGFCGFLPPDKVPQGWDRIFARSRGILARDRLPLKMDYDPLVSEWDESWGPLPETREVGFTRNERELTADQADSLGIHFSIFDEPRWEKA